jgi:selenophosphate synthetase-related protein
MDIYAAGGKPTSFAVALSYSDQDIGDAILEGLIDASQRFQVPIVRGHTNPQSSSTYVVGSATGTVKLDHMLTAGGATNGNNLILIFDSIGKRGSSYSLGWDTVTERTGESIVDRCSVMNELAERGLLSASKDVSVAGLVGTTGMLVEYSGMGGTVDLDAVEKHRPESISLEDWIRMFISLGFLVAAPQENFDSIERISKEHGMKAILIGSVNDSNQLCLKLGEEKEILFDFSKGPVLTPRGA